MGCGNEMDGKKQIGFAEKEAGIMAKKGHYEYVYSAQIRVAYA